MNGNVLLELKIYSPQRAQRFTEAHKDRGYFERIASASLAPDALAMPQHGPGGIGAP
jgi:hypothetical protein